MMGSFSYNSLKIDETPKKRVKAPDKASVPAAFDSRITRPTGFVRGSDVGYNLTALLNPRRLHPRRTTSGARRRPQ